MQVEKVYKVIDEIEQLEKNNNSVDFEEEKPVKMSKDELLHEERFASLKPISTFDTDNAIANNLNDLSQLRQRFRNLIDEELEQLDEKWQHLSKERDRLVNCAYSKKENAEKIVMKAFHDVWNVCHFKELPQWLQENDYLLFGHRPELGSFKSCVKSMFKLHTETYNIWSHLIGCLLFIGIASSIMLSNLDFTDKLMIGIYAISVIICFGLSTFYHILACHSRTIGNLFCRLDYCGICILISGSFFPCIYYGFYCDFYPKILYTILVIILSSITVVFSLNEKFNQPHFKPLRALVFFSFAISGVLPFLHWLTVQDWFSVSNLRFSLICLMSMAVLYILGAVLYAMRIPERWKPGAFDIHLHSHQLFHLCVVAGAIMHLQGIYGMATHRLENMCESDPSYYPSYSESAEQLGTTEKVSAAFNLFSLMLK